MRWPRKRSTVLALDRRLEWEAGVQVPPDWQPSQVAVVAHWSASGALSRSVQELCRLLVSVGFETLLISAAPFTGERPGPASPGDGVSLWRRPNSGYDFGTWSAALHAFPGIRGADEVLLVNDSMLGPFDDITPIIKRMFTGTGLVWGLTESFQKHWHLQSNFVGYRSGILGQPQFLEFWDGVAHQSSKDDVIAEYEIGLGRLLRRNDVPVEVAFPTADLPIRRRQNPTIRGWSALICAGLPMVKRQLVTDPGVAPDAAEVGPQIRRRFGQDVAGWM